MNKQATRMSVLGSMAAFVALAAMPATAATGVAASAFNQFSPQGENAQVSNPIQILNPPTPGPASVSAIRPTGTTTSVTHYGPAGLQRYYSSADLDVLGSQQSTAGGGFEDTIVIDTGTPGESGVATFRMRITGTLFASVLSPLGSADARTSLQRSNRDGIIETWMVSATPGSGVMPIEQIIVFERNFVSGQPVGLDANWRASAAVNLWEAGSGSAYADVTGRWLGLESAVTSDGRNVTSTIVITSESGYDYAVATPLVDLKSFTLKQAEVAGCKSASGTVTLTSPAPTGGFKVTLSDTLAAATAPAVVTLAAGTTSKSFNIPTTQVLARQAGEVTATGAAARLSAPLSVRPIGPLSVSLSPTAVSGGNPATGSVKLECPPDLAPIEVQLESTNAAAAYPVAASVVVPQGSSSATFDVATDPVLARSTATISGTANGIKKSRTLTVNVAAAVSPTSLKFGSVTVGSTSAPLNATLTNRGAVPFSVNSISLTGTNAAWFAQANDCPASLAPGASCTIGVTFSPLAAASRSAKLTIATSATSTPLSVSLSGAGI